MTSADGYIRDGWPNMPGDTEYDGKGLLALVRAGNSPFKHVWDANLLIQEVEKIMGTQVFDIPFVSKGSNNYVSVCIKTQTTLVTALSARVPGMQTTEFSLGYVGGPAPRRASGSSRCEHAVLWRLYHGLSALGSRV
jgi:hypothetical protein